MAVIQPIVMPKWGLAMQEGMLSVWHVAEGAAIAKGQEIADIETSKIANAFESPIAGTVRRLLVSPGEVVPVGALLAVIADREAADSDIDSFVDEFNATFAAEASSAAIAAPQPETVETGLGRLRYLRLGDAAGAPILFVHGFGGDLNNWLFNQPDLAASHTTYALDLPGHGGSTKQVGDGSIGGLTHTVLAFMDALAIPKVHYVGHSLGGAIGLDLALNHAERAASLTLVCPAGLGPEISMEFIDGFLATSRARKLKPVLEMLVANPDLVTNEMVEDVLKMKRLDGADAALNRIAGACFEGGQQALQLTARLGELETPTQVIWGGLDRIVPASHGKGLPAPIKVTVFEGAGHLAHMEKAAETNALIGALAG